MDFITQIFMFTQSNLFICTHEQELIYAGDLFLEETH